MKKAPAMASLWALGCLALAAGGRTESPRGKRQQPAQDSFPQLPAVNSILGSASDTMKKVSSQALVLEARVEQTQKDSEAKLAKQKAIYESKLRAQEERNRALGKQNQDISSVIENLKATNGDLHKAALDQARENKAMREEFRGLSAKLGLLQEYVAASLHASDDSGAPDLAVMTQQQQQQQPEVAEVSSEIEMRHHGHHHAFAERKQKEQQAAAAAKAQQQQVAQQKKGAASAAAQKDADEDEDEDGDEESDGDDKGESFLSLHKSVVRTSDDDMAVGDAETVVDPKDLVTDLSRGVADVQKQEREGEARLKGLFLESYKNGSRHHAALLAQQRSLNGTRDSLQYLREQLTKADGHLNGTRDELAERLKRMGHFLQKLAHVALAPQDEAPRLMEKLPSSVAAAAPAQQ